MAAANLNSLIKPKGGLSSDNVEELETASIDPGRRRRHLLILVSGLLLLAVWSGSRFLRIGFNPTDDGLILAQSSRLLAGETPHLDFATPRPVGSAILHLGELLVPSPLLLTSRFVVLLEILMTAILTVRLLIGRPIQDWGLKEASLAVATFACNLGLFPLMAWHTIDGLFVTVLALNFLAAAIRNDSRKCLLFAAFAAGFAPIIKQSFAPVPFLMICWLIVQSVPEDRRPSVEKARRVGLFAAVSTIPVLLYIAWVSEGFRQFEFIDQLIGANSVDPFLITGWSLSSPAVRVILGSSAALILLLAAMHLLRSGKHAGTLELSTLIFLFLVGVVGFSFALSLVVSGRMRIGEIWSQQLWWLAISVTCIRSVQKRELDLPAFSVCAMAWMASLSWGLPFPDLVSGGLFAVCIVQCSRFVQATPFLQPLSIRRVWRSAFGLTALLFGIALLLTTTTIRTETVYRDLAASTATSGLGWVSSAFRGIRSSDSTVEYIRQIRECTDRFPAKYLAILPDNAAIPILLGKHNPFPIDWWLPAELPDDRNFITSKTESINRRGDYLILFQTVAASSVAIDGSPRAATAGTPLFDYPGGMMQLTFETLQGTQVICGSFLGKYAAAPSN
ncbi:unannotated protein [freshwater metagenome]|uniref:Unannotated protein n=1 Tax=freshwater metagenome TaxID=449393 RepID=A0A6J6HNK5_9ZZZZ